MTSIDLYLYGAHKQYLPVTICHFPIDEEMTSPKIEKFTKRAEPSSKNKPKHKESPVKKIVSAADFFGASAVQQKDRKLAVKRKAVSNAGAVYDHTLSKMLSVILIQLVPR